jgi:gliding motility-associated-like protein
VRRASEQDKENGELMHLIGPTASRQQSTVRKAITVLKGKILALLMVVLTSGAFAQPTIITLNWADPLCNGSSNGAIDLFAIGVPPITYSIDNGSNFFTSGNFTGLPSGTYDIVIMDGNTATTTSQIIISDPAVLSLGSDSVANASCTGSDGYIDVTIVGGTGTYSYSWTGPNSFTSTSPTIPNLEGGTYDLTVTDINNCTLVLQYQITGGLGPVITNIEANDVVCQSLCDGSIIVTATGNSPFTFSLDSGVTYQASDTFPNLCDSTYDVMVMDMNGCTAYQQVTINPGTVVTADFSATPLSGNVPLNVVFTNNSFNSLSNMWDFDDNFTSNAVDTNYTYTSPGTYDVVLLAMNGTCVDSMTVQIVVVDTIVFVDTTISALDTIPNVFTPNNDGRNDFFSISGTNIVTLTCIIYNRYGEIVYSWDGINGGWDGRTAPAALMAPAGTYYYVLSATGEDDVQYDKNGWIQLFRLGDDGFGSN